MGCAPGVDRGVTCPLFFSKASTLCLTQGQLKSLRELHLDNNFLTGEIPRQHGKHGRKQPF